MPQEDGSLSAAELLLITLVVKVAVAATLATMLVRFGQFRRILLTEKRAWRERLTFAFAFGIPAGVLVGSRLLLGYNAGDLSVAGREVLVERPGKPVLRGTATGIGSHGELTVVDEEGTTHELVAAEVTWDC